jgi:hypothetical protein
MIIQSLISCFIGSLLGTIYGLIFIKRVNGKLVVSQPKNRLLPLSLFFGLYAVLAAVFFVISRFWQINLVTMLVSFLVVFWIIVLKTIRKLSV